MPISRATKANNSGGTCFIITGFTRVHQTARAAYKFSWHYHVYRAADMRPVNAPDCHEDILLQMKRYLWYPSHAPLDGQPLMP